MTDISLGVAGVGAIGQNHARVLASLKIPPGARVLELGVGTGLSLSAYPPHCSVTGIDLAQDMLDQAAQKIEEIILKDTRLAPHFVIELRRVDRLHLVDDQPRGEPDGLIAAGAAYAADTSNMTVQAAAARPP